MVKEKSKTVSFRIPMDYWDALVEQASERKISPGDFARRILLDSLRRDSFDSVRLELSLIRELIERVKGNQRTAIAAILTNAGKVSLQDAKEFMNRELL
jgi:hypothetical protein